MTTGQFTNHHALQNMHHTIFHIYFNLYNTKNIIITTMAIKPDTVSK